MDTLYFSVSATYNKIFFDVLKIQPSNFTLNGTLNSSFSIDS